jgi:hypothetical protein
MLGFTNICDAILSGNSKRTSWKKFLRSHRDAIAACDFFTVAATRHCPETRPAWRLPLAWITAR